jgi:hypothetical protein
MISIKFVTFVCLLFIGSIYSAVVEDSNDAKLLVSKTVINNYVVEGLNLTVKYTIYNIGNVYVYFGFKKYLNKKILFIILICLALL